LKYLKEKEKENKDGVTKIDKKLENEIISRIKDIWPEANVSKTYKQIEETLGYRDLLTVFSLDSGDQAYDIDIAILTSLLKG
jgi:hypothetical protein